MNKRDVTNQSVDAIVHGPQNLTVVETGPVLFTCSGTADQFHGM